MKLDFQKRIAAKIFKASPKRVVFVEDALEEIKDAVTRDDIRALIKRGAIYLKQKKGISRARANKLRIQKTKGRRKNAGSRKGSKKVRTRARKIRISSLRRKREFIRKLKERNKITAKEYRKLYRMIKGGFFRSVRHLRLYVSENLMEREE